MNLLEAEKLHQVIEVLDGHVPGIHNTGGRKLWKDKFCLELSRLKLFVGTSLQLKKGILLFSASRGLERAYDLFIY